MYCGGYCFPGEALPHQRYGLGLISRSRFKEAQAELLRAQQLEPLAMLPMINLAEAYARDRQSARALRQLATCRPDQPPQASIFIYLGQPGRVIATLQEPYDAHDIYIAYLNVDPTYDSLRGQPDFGRLLN